MLRLCPEPRGLIVEIHVARALKALMRIPEDRSISERISTPRLNATFPETRKRCWTTQPSNSAGCKTYWRGSCRRKGRRSWGSAMPASALEHRYVLPANTPFPPDRGRRNLLQRGVWCFRVDSPRSWVHNGLTCKRIPEYNPRWAPARLPHPATTGELAGLSRRADEERGVGLGAPLLKARTIAAPTFGQALNAIFTLADSVKPWKSLVESAYERLPKRQRGSVRFWIMSIRNGCHDNEGVLRLVPKRFTGEFGLLELMYAMDAAFGKNRKDVVRKLALRLPRAINQAECPLTRALRASAGQSSAPGRVCGTMLLLRRNRHRSAQIVSEKPWAPL